MSVSELCVYHTRTMNPNSRTVKVIETSLSRLEATVASSMGDGGESAALDALGLLDESRRLERKWIEQVAAGSPRRKPTDYAVMEGWCRRWLRAASGLAHLTGQVGCALSTQRAAVERDIATKRFRAAATAMRGGTSSG